MVGGGDIGGSAMSPSSPSLAGVSCPRVTAVKTGAERPGRTTSPPAGSLITLTPPSPGLAIHNIGTLLNIHEAEGEREGDWLVG